MFLKDKYDRAYYPQRDKRTGKFEGEVSTTDPETGELKVNVGIKLLDFHQLSWLERFPPLASQAKFWELLKKEHFLINRGITQKSTA